MASPIEGATEYIESVRFGFLSTEEAKKYGPIKVTNTNLLDSVGRPVAGGMYDPGLGPLDEQTPCKSCGQRSYHCPGHFGRMDLCSIVYNPLLFNELYILLQATCFFCRHFRASRTKVETCVSQLTLIAKGDVSGAKNLDPASISSGNASSYPEDSDGSHVSCPRGQNGSIGDQTNYSKPQEWTSLQEREAMSILGNFLREKYKKCKKCDAKNPKITKPTFGWLSTNMLASHARENVINECGLEDDSDGGLASSEVESTDGSRDTVRKKRRQDASANFSKQTRGLSGPLLPPEVENIIKSLWENEPLLCSFISNIQQQGNCSVGTEAGYSMFFLKTVLVTPIKFRPPANGGDSVMEHPHTVLLNKVLQCNVSLKEAADNEKFGHSIFVTRWRDLQLSINVYFNSKTATGNQNVESGICQVLEKKEGLFRQKMMGKRVNYACRSVISPDNNLAVNEIGIPPYFATRLTYPERVTPWNVHKLREAIVNGPDVHPGATRYIDKISTKMLPSCRKSRIAISRKLPSSRGAVTQSGKASDPEYEGKVVYRHLRDGDIVLVNRQPTLHKPSIMAHVVRILKGERTLRMHYANCSTYNADFDGDEMNVHFPQDEISRAEAYNIVNANNQYVKPTNGDPVRALIQDHIVSAALLTKKDTFLTRDEFSQLLYTSGISSSGLGSFSKKPGKKVTLLNSEDELKPPLPAVWKPEPLWTGKQVITAMLNHITRDHQPFSVEKECNIPPVFFKSKTGKVSRRKSGDGEEKGNDKDQLEKNGHGEHILFIHNNDLVHGVIDKAQFAGYGLVHKVQVLYGSNTAGVLLSTMSRLFTAYLQMHGFTCGLDDLLIKRDRDIKRKMQLDEAQRSGEKIHRAFLGIKGDAIVDPKELQTRVEEYVRRNGELALMSLDRKMLSGLNEYSQRVNRELLSEGLWKPSVKNCISLMTTSGAKGGTVNFQQISSYLGSQELEGKRVPRMVSGKTLPCFSPWDCSSRSGGFIIDRFLTGLRPQEYYFHCMAGREGLVDTAVKTSRSGYLQRCLIKNLECLKVSYDHTVRDADGSIVQFFYGEDGVDVHRSKYLAKFEVLATNPESESSKHSNTLSNKTELEPNGYVKKLPLALAKKAEDFIEQLTLNQRITRGLPSRDEFMKLVKHHYLLNLAQPGEPVGVLSAQSVGEPSTQMTLNTFHLAGRGEMNVTLGIPRLQEILMTASNDIKTPIMTCPLQLGRTQEDATHLALELKRISIADLIETLNVSVGPFSLHDRRICRIYKLVMKLSAPHLGISVEKCEETLSTSFLREIEDAIESTIKLLRGKSGIEDFEPDSQPFSSNETEDGSHNKSRVGVEEEEDHDGEEGEDLGLDAQKQKQQATDEMDYEDGSEDDHLGSEVDDTDNQVETDEDDDTAGGVDAEAKISDLPSEHASPSKVKSSGKKTKPEGKPKRKKKAITKKDFDRAIFVEAEGMHFEAHFKMTDEPHILLAQIAERAAKKVYVQSSGKVDNCQPTNCKESQVIYYGKDPKKRSTIDSKELELMPAIQTTGVDFLALWKLQDALDVRYIYSNSIHDMLNTYGVEAARATLINEINHVFKSYGILVNYRHLSLIADFMTHAGGYRPMSRMGGIADSASPFSKMTFETAAKFIVEAAYHGELDNLETPSARICLGLPVKMGTGCFDLMQKLDVE